MYPLIHVEYCVSNCKPPEEIDRFIDDLFIMFMVKGSYYNSTNYEGTAVRERVQQHFTRVFVDHNTQSQGQILITKESLNSEEKLYDLGIFSEETEFYTFSEDLKISEYNKKIDYPLLLEIEFAQNTEMIQQHRVIYGPLDLLGDFGGLREALVSIGSIMLSFL